MVQVRVSSLEIGDVLLEDVLTHRGNILFFKGTVLTERDLEILKAFMIDEVAIDPSGSKREILEIPDDSSSGSSLSDAQIFEQHYEQLLQIMKRVFKNTSVAEDLPIVEMRNHLEIMVQHYDYQDFLITAEDKIKVKDYLFHKSIGVGLISYYLASWSKFKAKDLMPAALAGLLHDIGNMEIDPALLNKPGRLTKEEMEEVKKHTIIGYHRLKSVKGINEGVKLAALQHHEREDGSGYPLGLTGDKIHPYAKVVAIADVFYAMTHSTKYQQARSPYVVLEQLTQDAFGKLNPAFVQTFIHKLTQHQIGYTVRLSCGRIGKIVYADSANPTRPWVEVQGEIINLTQKRDLYIEEVISHQLE